MRHDDHFPSLRQLSRIRSRRAVESFRGAPRNCICRKRRGDAGDHNIDASSPLPRLERRRTVLCDGAWARVLLPRVRRLLAHDSSPARAVRSLVGASLRDRRPSNRSRSRSTARNPQPDREVRGWRFLQRAARKLEISQPHTASLGSATSEDAGSGHPISTDVRGPSRRPGRPASLRPPYQVRDA